VRVGVRAGRSREEPEQARRVLPEVFDASMRRPDSSLSTSAVKLHSITSHLYANSSSVFTLP
jgi:hypothetical protein